MKIAILAAACSIHTKNWANSLANSGHEIHLISIHKDINHIANNVYLHYLPFSIPLGYYLNIFHLKKLLNKIKPNILHTHFTSGYGTLGRLSSYHPYILSVWGSDVSYFPYKSKFNLKVTIKNLLAADYICATSQVLAEQITSICPAITEINIIPFGINCNHFKPQKREKDSFVIGTVKIMSKVYGTDLLIKAFAKVIEYLKDRKDNLLLKIKLMIVGESKLSSEFHHLSESLGLSKYIIFYGMIPHDMIPDMLNQFDIYVALSRSESFGVAILEASACELPVIVSNVGGLPEVVDNNITGFVIETEDIDAAYKAMLKLINNQEIRTNMGKAGREKVLKHYNWNDNVAAMEKLYQNILI